MTSILTTNDFFGSRFRCLALTGLPKAEVARVLTGLTGGFAKVSNASDWMPKGPRHPNEVKLGESNSFLSDAHQAELRSWWLKHKSGIANTPNWDIASSCEIEGQPGLLLVEAKAHESELSENGKTVGAAPTLISQENHAHIGNAVKEANDWFKANTAYGGWNLSHTSHYQLANRIAWAWKIASMGVPVALVYLGFLNASDMENGKSNLFASAMVWHNYVLGHSKSVVPASVWENKILVKAPLLLTTASLELTFK